LTHEGVSAIGWADRSDAQHAACTTLDQQADFVFDTVKLGRLSSETVPGYSRSFSYDSFGRPSFTEDRTVIERDTQFPSTATERNTQFSSTASGDPALIPTTPTVTRKSCENGAQLWMRDSFGDGTPDTHPSTSTTPPVN